MKGLIHLSSFVVIAVGVVAIILALTGSGSRQNAVFVMNRSLTDVAAQISAQNETVNGLLATVQAMTPVVSTVTLLSSGTLRWYSNCQVGARSIAPDFAFPFTKTYAYYDGKPETTYNVSRVDTPEGCTSFVIDVLGPPLIEMTNADSTRPCRVYAVSDQPFWVEAAEYSIYKFMSLRPQDYLSMDPPCDGTTCQMRNWTLAYFRSTEASAAAYLELHTWTSSDFPFYYAESVFMARNMTFSETPIQFVLVPSFK
jgi:hypothetical protein